MLAEFQIDMLTNLREKKKRLMSLLKDIRDKEVWGATLIIDASWGELKESQYKPMKFELDKDDMMLFVSTIQAKIESINAEMRKFGVECS